VYFYGLRNMNAHPDMPEDQFTLAKAAEERGEYIEAYRLWKELASRSNDASDLCHLAHAARKLGLDAEAEQAFRSAIRADSSLPWGYVGLGILLRHLGDASEAVKLFMKASTLEKSASISTLLGAALVDLERIDEAEEAFKAAVRIDPAYEEAYFNLAMLKSETNSAEAETLFLRAIELDPDYALAHCELGALLKSTEPSVQAEYHLRRALELDNNELWARIHLGNLLWSRDNASAAIAEFERAVELHPDASMPLWCIANVYETQELWEQAGALYERALEIEPDDSVAHMNYGRMLKRQGDRTGSETHLRTALLLDPKYEAARKLLADLLQS
jgi:tetratricopeptide (TPR) repeat protein